MPSHIAPESRTRAFLLPHCLDEVLAADHIARVIDAYVGRLDMIGLGFLHAVPAEKGRPSYNPADLLRLYMYGYVDGTQSSRGLERECQRNSEVMWLLGKLAPDHKTIAAFRKHNGTAIAAVCADFVQFCRSQGKLSQPEVAVDGTKIMAASGRHRLVTKTGLEKRLKKIRDKVDRYMKELDAADAAEDAKGVVPARVDWLKAALQKLQQHDAALVVLHQELEYSARESQVVGEPEARGMYCNGAKVAPSYNVQAVLSTDTHLIVHHDLTRDVNDRQQLFVMAEAAQAAMGLQPTPDGEGPKPAKLQVLADAGYSNGEDIARCEAADIVPCAPPQRAVNQKGLFDVSKFIYDAESNSYTCPAGKRLHFKQRANNDKLYRYTAEDCTSCDLRKLCTTSNRRSVTRSWFEDELVRMAKRVESDRSLMKRRRSTAEHPFGTLKRKFGGKFLTKGMLGARAELALQVLSMNVVRLGRLCGVPSLLAALA